MAAPGARQVRGRCAAKTAVHRVAGHALPIDRHNLQATLVALPSDISPAMVRVALIELIELIKFDDHTQHG